MAEEGVAAGGVMDVSTALQEVVSSTLIHSGLACGTQEAAKAFDKLQAHLCVLAPNCDEPMHVKLVEAPCAEHQVNLIRLMTTGNQVTVEASVKQIGRESYVKCRLWLRNG